MKFTPTRIEPLVLAQIAPGIWQFCDTTDRPTSSPSQVGPQYRTKFEALADLDRYARDSGWLN